MSQSYPAQIGLSTCTILKTHVQSVTARCHKGLCLIIPMVETLLAHGSLAIRKTRFGLRLRHQAKIKFLSLGFDANRVDSWNFSPCRSLAQSSEAR